MKFGGRVKPSTCGEADGGHRELIVDQLHWRELSGDVTTAWPVQGPRRCRIKAANGNLKLD